VLKAIAYGAKAVMLGRPVLWGLAVGGEKGVKDVVELIEEEFRVAMALSGCGKVSDITRELIYDRRKYARL
jgi:isopentenyl diphosphate isomerase/L-lactate dehydrogenase-like FMN-dependent dehydrogenase